MKQRIINTYEFKELNEEAQQRALNDNCGINTEYDWYDCLFEDFKEQLNQIGVDCDTFYFDLERNKHIVMENAQITDEELFLKSVGLTPFLILNKFREVESEFDIGVDKSGEIELNLSTCDYLSDEEVSKREREALEIEERATDFLKDKLNEFINTLEKDYEYLSGEEAIKETIELNEKEFLETGEQF